MMDLSKLSGSFTSQQTDDGNPYKISAPDAFIRIYSWKDQYTVASNKKKISQDSVSYNIYEGILSIDTEKHKEGPGNWSVHLSGVKNYNAMVYPGDWITIHISDQKINVKDEIEVKKTIKMMGIIKTVRRIESATPDGVRSIKYVIAGTDWSSALHTPIYINSMLFDFQEAGAKEGALATFVHGVGQEGESARRGGPGTAVQKILYVIFAGGHSPDKSSLVTGQQFSVPAELVKLVYGKSKIQNSYLSFLNFIINDFQEKMHGISDVRPDFGGVTEGWSLLKTYSNPILNELFAETYVDKDGNIMPTLVLRSIPFSQEKLKGAPQLFIKDSLDEFYPTNSNNKLYVSKTIDESEIIQLNFGKSDAERFNFWMVTPNQMVPYQEQFNIAAAIESAGGLAGLGHLISIKRYGLRPYVSSSVFWAEELNGFRTLSLHVRDLWDSAVFHENGMVEIVGSDKHIPVGTNIIFRQRSWAAHVESVSHKYFVDPIGRKGFKTSIGFVRLQDFNGEPLFVNGVADEIVNWDYEPRAFSSNGWKNNEDENAGVTPNSEIGSKVEKKDKSKMKNNKAKKQTEKAKD